VAAGRGGGGAGRRLHAALVEQQAAQVVERGGRLALAVVVLELEAEHVRDVLRVEEAHQPAMRHARRHRLERLEHDVEHAVRVEVEEADERLDVGDHLGGLLAAARARRARADAGGGQLA